MTIRRIEILEKGERVRVEELITPATAIELASSLDEEGLHAEASWYLARKKESRGKAFWDVVFSGPAHELSDKEYSAFHDALRSRKTRAFACVF